MRRTFVKWLVLFLVGCSAAPPLAAEDAPGVQLGNVVVPREKFVVFLMIGHCNMMGQALYPEQGSHPRAWAFDLNQRPPRWVPAKPRNDVNQLGAPTLPFLQALATAYPDYYFGVINNASSAAYVQANYRRGRRNYAQIVNVARNLKPYVTLGGVVTMLGYMEAENGRQTRAFGDQFIAMTQEMRADLDEPDLPFFITQFEVGASKKGPGWMAITNTIDQIPQHIPNTAVIPTVNFIYDSDHHPSYQSFKLWAARAVSAVGALSAAQQAEEKADKAEPEKTDATPPKSDPPFETQTPPVQLPRVAQTQPIIVPRNNANHVAANAAKSTVTAPPIITAEVEAVLLKTSSTPDPRQILPYKEGVACAYYEVKQVLNGHLDSRQVLVMQMVIAKGQLLPMANLKVGATYRLKLGTWSSVPHVHTYPMFDDIMDFESPIYYVHSAEPLASS